MERQRWLPLEANPEVRAALISAWGRGQGRRNRVDGASSRQSVSKSCSLFRFQVTNQVSEVPCRSRPWSSLWPSTPPRSLRVWDLIPGRSLLRVFQFYGCSSPTWLLKMLPAVSALPYGPIPPSSHFLGFRGFRDFTLYPYCSFSFLLLPARADSIIFPPLYLLGD